VIPSASRCFPDTYEPSVGVTSQAAIGIGCAKSVGTESAHTPKRLYDYRQTKATKSSTAWPISPFTTTKSNSA
jgi:hypothetical protein